MTKRTFQLRAGIKRSYGQHEISFEIAEQIEADSTGQVRDGYISLLALLNNQIKLYEELELPHVKLPQGAVTNAGGQSAEQFNLDTISVEFTDGKRVVKAKGGKYDKFGVRVYDECQTDLDIAGLTFGEHKQFSTLNLTCYVDLENGKAKRVRAIK